jgi:hypothetical protein
MSSDISGGEATERVADVSIFDRRHAMYARTPADEQAPRPSGGPRPLPLSRPQTVAEAHIAAKQMPQPRRQQQGA